MERELTAAEKAEYFRKNFQLDASGLIKERKSSGGYVVAERGTPLTVIIARVNALIARIDELGY